ncbi:AMP-dependent synthetase [Bacillus sp. FJAT-27916]|uniref:AMP-binding protein n=1 Tax=Bacillus sp. FJAT-27916 TaxID=1679169 RepID=UPI0006707BD7|nr:AMP-binding protein [Bacillus sp. FJAT-27916]KMY44506.1 AMP-dependent synthetase [Bacillus sp. FJAT-27916]
MEEVKDQSFWPSGVPTKLTYKCGEKPLHEYLKLNAGAHPDKAAYLFYGNTISYKELDHSVDRFAQFLHNQQIKKGDRVALYMQNCPQYIIAHYAIQLIGGIVVPLNPMYKEAELQHLLNIVEAKAIIAGTELYRRVSSIRSSIPSIDLAITAHYADYLPKKPTLPIPEELKDKKITHPDAIDFKRILYYSTPYKGNVKLDLWTDIGMMVFTSGTTGRSKAAMLPYGSSLFKTAATWTANQFEEGSFLSIAPLCHIAGMVMGVYLPIYSGQPCVMLTRFDVEATVQAIEQYKITHWYSTAPMNLAILKLEDSKKRDLSSLKQNPSTSFGASVTETLAFQWAELTNESRLYEAAYGLSETHTCDTFMPKDKVKWGSFGIPTYETKMKIIDIETGEGMLTGEKGEILIQSPAVFKGYYKNEKATAETIKDGWVHTGDIGSIDEDGYLYFHGRLKEMIKTSGFSVFPEDVEAMLNEHPAIWQSAVIGVPDPMKGEVVKAFIVLQPGIKEAPTMNELKEWAKSKMAAFKVPSHIEWIHKLPATSSGKVLRRLLKEEPIH